MRLQTIVVRVARVSTLPPSPGMPLQVRVLILNTSATGNEPNTGQKSALWEVLRSVECRHVHHGVGNTVN